MPYTSAKLAYIVSDMQRCASFYGIPLTIPNNFPINGLYLLRGTVFLEGRPECKVYRKAAYRATWIEDRDVSDRDVAIEIAKEVGLDIEEFSDGISSPSVKEKLQANTAITIERGAFGVPTFFVRDEMFWGQDRLDFVRRELERVLNQGA